MPTLELNSALEGRSSVSPRARQNLRTASQTCGMQTIFVVKDPITMRYFRMDEKQKFLVDLMDGQHTLAEIKAAYQRRFRPDRMSADEIENFVAELLDGGLVQCDSPAASERLIERTEKQIRQKWLSLLNILYIKIPLTNPDRRLKTLQPLGRIVFSTTFLIVTLAMFMSAIGLVATRWAEFEARLPVYRDFFRLEMVAYLWLTFGLVKVLHEFGHALICKRMGAEVSEMGIVILCFFPTLYCNASDSWLLPNKWKRIAVSAAGIYVEMVLAALATFIWWWTDSETFLHQWAFAIVLYCSLHTLTFNANPLMRFDGYHVLADLLEAPNLAQQSQRALQSAVLRWLRVEINDRLPTGRMSNRFLIWFGLAVLVYRWYVMAMVLWFLCEFTKQHHVPVVGWGLATCGIAVLMGMPIWQISHWLLRHGRLPEMKPVRVWLTLAGLAGAAAFFFLIPLPMKVRGIALIQPVPEQVRRVIVPETEGFLQELLVRDGQYVKANEVLAVLVNPKLETKIRLNEADQASRVEQQNAFIARFAEGDESDQLALAGWMEAESELKSLSEEHRILIEQGERLILRAPTDGTVMRLLTMEEKGKWLAKGSEFCRVGSDETLRALVLVPSADHRLVRVGSHTSVFVHGVAGRQWAGAVTSVAQVEAKNIPEALSNRVGGDVATQQDPATKMETPHGQHYLASIHFKAGDPAIQAGVLGRVKIDADAQTMWWRLRRWMGTTLNWGL